MSKKTTGPNDKITGIAEKLGYCCPHGMLKALDGDRQSHERVARKTGLTAASVRFNRYKMRDGELPCSNLANCQKDKCDDKP